MAHTGINVICIVLLMIHMFAAEDASCHKTDQACRVVAWREWESCRGLCKHPTQQVRKRTICIDDKLLSQRNFSREDVIKYCNITQPTLEYRPCPICPTGVYSEESQKCELCGKLFSIMASNKFVQLLQNTTVILHPILDYLIQTRDSASADVASILNFVAGFVVYFNAQLPLRLKLSSHTRMLIILTMLLFKFFFNFYFIFFKFFLCVDM